MTLEEKREIIKDCIDFDVFNLPLEEIENEKLKKWVEGLESGEFIQNGSYLVTDYGGGVEDYCCLGVYAVYVENLSVDELDNIQVLSMLHNSKFDAFEKSIPVGHKANTLEGIFANMNDGMSFKCNNDDWYNVKFTFQEIAECIKRSSYERTSD